jgi:hypothetical protein
MPWSLTIGCFGGTAVRVHITFIIFLAWIGFSAWQSHGSAARNGRRVLAGENGAMGQKISPDGRSPLECLAASAGSALRCDQHSGKPQATQLTHNLGD